MPAGSGLLLLVSLVPDPLLSKICSFTVTFLQRLRSFNVCKEMQHFLMKIVVAVVFSVLRCVEEVVPAIITASD